MSFHCSRSVVRSSRRLLNLNELRSNEVGPAEWVIGGSNKRVDSALPIYIYTNLYLI